MTTDTLLTTTKVLTSNTIIELGYGSYRCDATSGGFTVTIPDAAAFKAKSFFLSRADQVAVNVVGVVGVLGQTIGGLATFPLGPNSVNHFTSDGSNWTLTATNSASLLPSTDQMVYVAIGGNDITGNGTPQRPYATIGHALSTITDATTTKRYAVMVGPGEYPGAWNIKPYVGIVGVPSSSNFFGLVEITAAANTIGYDAVAYAASGFSVSWFSHLVFANLQTFDDSKLGNDAIQLNWFDCNMNNGWNITGLGQSGVSNMQLENCLVYGGMNVQGLNYLWVRNTTLLGGTLTYTGAWVNPSAQTVLMQGSTLGSYTNPTSLTLIWPPASPGGTSVVGDFSSSTITGTLTLNGANVVVRSTVDSVPLSVTLLNGAPPAQLKSVGTGLGYVAATPGNWVAPPPSNISAAVDRMSNVLFANFGAIP